MVINNQKIVPNLWFDNQAEEAAKFYASIFDNSSIDYVMRYEKGEELAKQGTIKHAGFVLGGQEFASMDSAKKYDFGFNEAISLMVECDNQEEIDYYWGKLTSGGRQESVCGWLKDRFGLSWQVAPGILADMLRDPDKEKVERVTNAFLKMKKFDIGELRRAYSGLVTV